MTGYLSVTNFRRHQHYKHRKPPWVKFYVDLLDPHNKLNLLPIEARFLFDRMLLLAAEWDNAIPNDSELIAKLVAMQPRQCRQALAALVEGRWLVERKTKRRASKPASNGASNVATTEQEAEQETERELEQEAEALVADAGYVSDRDLDRLVEVQRILGYCRDSNTDSEGVLMFYARQVPLSGVVRIRENCRRQKACGVGYAVNAFKSEAKAA